MPTFSGVKPSTSFKGDIVINQYPNANTVLNKSDKVFLVTNNELKMLDVTNYSKNDLQVYCHLTNLNCHIKGYGYVTKQSIPKDTLLTNNLEVEFELKELYEEEDKDEKTT